MFLFYIKYVHLNTYIQIFIYTNKKIYKYLNQHLLLKLKIYVLKNLYIINLMYKIYCIYYS